MGDALGNIIPLASVAVSEPSKAAFVTNRVPLMASLSALALENIFYSLSVAVFIFSGTVALLLAFPLKPALRYASFGTLAVTILIVPLGFLVIRRRWKFLSGLMLIFGRRNIARAWMEKTIPRARTFEDRIYGFYQRNSNRLLLILALEMTFHCAGVLEIYTTLWFISGVLAPTLLTAFILESVNRVINVVFKFIPLRTGVDEAGTGMLSKVLGFTTAIGVTLASGATFFGQRSAFRLWCGEGWLLKNLIKFSEKVAYAEACTVASPNRSSFFFSGEFSLGFYP